MRKKGIKLLVIPVAFIVLLLIAWIFWPRVRFPDSDNLVSVEIWIDTMESDQNNTDSVLAMQIVEDEEIINKILSLDGRLFKMRKMNPADIFLGLRPEGVYVKVIYTDVSYHIALDPRYGDNNILISRGGEDSIICRFISKSDYEKLFKVLYEAYNE